MDRQFYHQHYELVYKYILYTTHEEHLAHDLLQEKFYKFFRRAKMTISNEQAYLLRIARNLIYDHFRKKRLIQFFTLKEDTRIDDAPLPEKSHQCYIKPFNKSPSNKEKSLFYVILKILQ